MKYLELVPFEMRITAETVVRALAEDAYDGKDVWFVNEGNNTVTRLPTG
jgi:hypothetical protein